jgi:hypothetical protein
MGLIAMLIFPSQAQTADEIAAKAAQSIEFESLEMGTTLIIRDAKGNERRRQIEVSTRKFGAVTKTRMRFIAPAEVKGTAILIYDYDGKDDDMWVFMPASKQTRRIVSNEKGKSFMGSEFSNADMSKPNQSDFSHSIMGSETIDGKACWKLESKCLDAARSSRYGYKRKISYIDKANYLSYRIEFYNQEDKLFKTLNYQDYRKQSTGKYFSYKMEAKNHVNGRSSSLIVDRFNIGSKLTEIEFDPAKLDQY